MRIHDQCRQGSRRQPIRNALTFGYKYIVFKSQTSQPSPLHVCVGRRNSQARDKALLLLTIQRKCESFSLQHGLIDFA